MDYYANYDGDMSYAENENFNAYVEISTSESVNEDWFTQFESEF